MIENERLFLWLLVFIFNYYNCGNICLLQQLKIKKYFLFRFTHDDFLLKIIKKSVFLI